MRRIRRFVSESRLRLNLALAAKESANALLAAASLAFLTALPFTLSGHRVQIPWLILPAAAGVALFAMRMAILSHSRRSAAAAADKMFGLKDAISSSLEFEGVEGRNAFHSLQLESAASICKSAPLSSIRIKPPWRLLYVAAALLVATAALCSLGDSMKVAAKKSAEAATLEKSSALKKAIKEEVEKMKKGLDEEERRQFERSRLAKIAEGMKESADPRDALRQYAEMQCELDRLLDRASLREDDKLLADVAKRLKEDPATREMGAMIAANDMKSATEELQKMSISKARSQDGMKSAEERLERLLRHLEKMDRETSRREGMKSDLKESMQKLSNSASDSQRDMERACKECASKGEPSEGTMDKLSSGAERTNSGIERLAREMKSHGARKSFLSKSESLASALMKAQQSMASEGSSSRQSPEEGQPQSQGMGESQGKDKGNKGIGTASASNFDNAPTGASKDGYDTSLTGQKGSGDSIKKVESASSGSGKALIPTKANDAEFKRQLESFIRREDVPDSMKGAVKLYFNSLHDDK